MTQLTQTQIGKLWGTPNQIAKEEAELKAMTLQLIRDYTELAKKNPNLWPIVETLIADYKRK